MKTYTITKVPAIIPRSHHSQKMELRIVTNSILRSLEMLDFKGYIQWFLDSPEFVFVDSYGTRMNYDNFYEKMELIFNGAAKMKNSSLENTLIFLPESTVLSVWTGQSSVVLKSGFSLVYNRFICTSLLKKFGNMWKIIFRQESNVGLHYPV